MRDKRLLILIPAFNEEETISEVIASLPKKLKKIKSIDILVIDDGSSDNTAEFARKKGAKVLFHVINRGLGGALGTGFAYAQKNNYDIVLTFDADGQHSANDVKNMIKPIAQEEVDVVIGSRLVASSSMPLLRKIVNSFSNILTFLLFGIWTTDSQSGLRAFSKKAISTMELQTQGMEVSSEIFREIKKKSLTKKEISIKAIYTDYSLKKGQQLTNAPNVFWKLFLQRFKTSLNF